MAKLVRTICATCGKPVRPKSKSGHDYVHVDSASGPSLVHPIVIKMVTLIESF